ncbi:MAG: DUF721 domain-containing protein [Proteobacteria bacterium]|nr:DUF721 domain-containing protein [Pseudomonadota bacterium]
MVDALARSTPLELLRERIRESNARYEAIRVVLPAALAAHVRPGPLDDTGWSLLAANAAVAAKLRQLQPRLEAVLREQGRPVAAIRIKVLR